MEANNKVFQKTLDERDMLVMENQKLKHDLSMMKRQQERDYEKLTESIDTQKEKIANGELVQSILTDKHAKTENTLGHVQEELASAELELKRAKFTIAKQKKKLEKLEAES